MEWFDLQRRVTKIIQKGEILQLQSEIKEVKIINFTRKTNKMWSNWNFQNNEISYIFSIFLLELKTYCQDRF